MQCKRWTIWALAVVLTGVSGPALAEDAPRFGFDNVAGAVAQATPPEETTGEERLRLDADAPRERVRSMPSRWGPDADDFEFTLSGVASNDGRFKQGAFGVDATLGYYVTRELSVELRQGVAFEDRGESFWSGSTRGAVDWHFDFDRFRPFVGIGLGGFYGERISDTGGASIEGGAKFYVKPDTFLYGRIEHFWLFDSGDRDERVFGNRQMLYTIGIGFNF